MYHSVHYNWKLEVVKQFQYKRSKEVVFNDNVKREKDEIRNLTSMFQIGCDSFYSLLNSR